jgi:hypothetical protein
VSVCILDAPGFGVGRAEQGHVRKEFIDPPVVIPAGSRLGGSERQNRVVFRRARRFGCGL